MAVCSFRSDLFSHYKIDLCIFNGSALKLKPSPRVRNHKEGKICIKVKKNLPNVQNLHIRDSTVLSVCFEISKKFEGADEDYEGY